MWVGGCVTTPAMWASPPGRRRRGVHRSAKMASRRRFEAFVYTVAPREDRASDRGDAGVYTDRPKWPLRAVLERLCTLLRRKSRYESQRELPASGGTSASATMACRRRPLAGPSRLVGKTGPERAAPLPGCHLGRGVNPHEPLKSPLSQRRPEGSQRQPGKPAIVNSLRASTPVFLWWAASESVTARTMPRWRFPPDGRPYPQTACR